MVFYLFLLMMVSFIVSMLSYMLGNSVGNSEKKSAYECGYEAFEDGRDSFEVKFYLVGLYFMIFDLEMCYIIPFMLSEDMLGSNVVFILDFIMELVIGYVFIWRMGALKIWMNDVLMLGCILSLMGLFMSQDMEDLDILSMVSMVSCMQVMEDEDLMSLFLCMLCFMLSLSLDVNWGMILGLISMGMLFMMDSEEFLMLYGGMELQSLGLYMVLMNMNGDMGGEGSMKYLMISSLGSSFLLLGGLLFYESGYIFLEDWMSLCGGDKLGLVCLVLGVLIKLGMFPVVDWMVTVVDGVEDMSGMILSTISKLGYLLVLSRFSLVGDEVSFSSMCELVGLMSLMSSGISCFYASSFKSFLVFSSMGHLGMMLLSWGSSWMFYMVVYMLVSLCLWELLMVMKWTYLEDMMELRKESIKGLMMFLMMCILSGIPPFMGFFIKLDMMLEMMESMMYKELFIVMGYVLMSSFNYMSIVRVVYFDNIKSKVKNSSMDNINGNGLLNDVIGMIVVLLFIL